MNENAGNAPTLANDFDAVVGAGPVNLMRANLLGSARVRDTVFENCQITLAQSLMTRRCFYGAFSSRRTASSPRDLSPAPPSSVPTGSSNPRPCRTRG